MTRKYILFTVLIISFLVSACTESRKNPRELSDEQDDFVVLAVNLQDSDTPEGVAAFKKERGYDFNFVLDKNEVGPKVISFGIPFKIFIDPNGYLIKAEVGSNGTAGDYLKAKTIIEDNKLK